MLYPKDGGMAYTMTAKTEEVRRKWIEAIHMAQYVFWVRFRLLISFLFATKLSGRLYLIDYIYSDNTGPPNARDNKKDFVMFSYDKPTTCDVCHKLLRGVFYQGYRCNSK